jgi:heme/copper-type cytochrome/quinol oxidase subunit 2
VATLARTIDGHRSYAGGFMIVGLINGVAVILIVAGALVVWRIRRKRPATGPRPRRISSTMIEGIATAVGIISVVVSLVIVAITKLT